MDIIVESPNLSATARHWNSAPRIVKQRITPVLRRIGLRLQQLLMDKLSNNMLNVRTGNLRRAVFYRIEQVGDDHQVRAGVDSTRAIYWRILNFGGIITPKRGQFLTIPVGPNLTSKGVARVSAREFINAPGTLGFTGSFVNRKKTAIMGTRRGSPPVPVFALKRNVRIRATGFLASARNDALSYISAEMQQAADEIVKDLSRVTAS